ncbi:Flagellar hook-length control protein fliK, partial [Pseudomonas amygdali pv. tabaci]
MPLATNALLQATSTATSRSGTANNAVKSADSSKDGASSFSNVYAKQAKDAVPSRDDAPVKPARDKAAPDKDKVAAGKDKPASDQANAADTSSVADSGNDLPTRSTAAEDDAASAGSKQDDAQASADSALTEGLAIVDPVLDPALQAMAAQAPALPVARPQSPDATAAPVATVLTVTQAAPPAATEEAFNPDADPLDGLDAVQLALENANAKTQLAAQNTHAANKATPTNAEADPNQNLVNNLSALSEQLPSEESSTESSDKSFSGLIGEGLKDVKSAAGDTRVDNFADRLA